MIKHFPILLLLLLLNSVALTQNNTVQNMMPGFINLSENKFQNINETESFATFFKNLNIDHRKQSQITILQIGDSHIQADMFSSQLRNNFKSFFGELRGRGLIFPYSVAKTNGPADYKVIYSGKWDVCRNVDKRKECNLGISGISVTTNDVKSKIALCYFGFDSVCSPVHIFKIIHEAGKSDFEIRVNGKNSINTERIDSLIACSEFHIDPNSDSLMISFSAETNSEQKATIHGFIIENNDVGLEYHSAGINGADVLSVLSCPNFENQLQFLKPQLVIISLGTNDAYLEKFDEKQFRSNYSRLIESVLKNIPGVSIILTTPGDSYRQKRYLNLNYIKTKDIIFEMALKYKCAVWDFYSIMGGLNSILLWRKNNLCTDDMLHFNSPGYKLQADLFFGAFIQSYDFFNK